MHSPRPCDGAGMRTSCFLMPIVLVLGGRGDTDSHARACAQAVFCGMRVQLIRNYFLLVFVRCFRNSAQACARTGSWAVFWHLGRHVGHEIVLLPILLDRKSYAHACARAVLCNVPDWPTLAPRAPDWFKFAQIGPRLAQTGPRRLRLAQRLFQEAQIGSDWPQEVHIHIHLQTNIQIHIHTRIHIHIHRHLPIHIHIDVHTYTYTYLHTPIHIYTYIHRRDCSM